MASDARLFVLATVDRLGEAHGHEMAREAAASRTPEWAHVSQSGLYSALRRCERDGLVEPVRIEQIGRFPVPTVYRLTSPGRDVLARTRAEAWQDVGLPPDPFDLALRVADARDPMDLASAAARRLEEYVRALHVLQAEFAQLRDVLEPTAVAVFEHTILRHGPRSPGTGG